MVKNENYVQISGWMVNELNLSGNELLVYALIHGFSQDGKSLFKGSISYIQEWLNCGSKQTVINAIKKLIDKQLIEKKVVLQGKEVAGCEYWTVASRKKKDGSQPLSGTKIRPQQTSSLKNGLPLVQILDDPGLKNGLPPSPNFGHNILNSNSNDTAAVKNSLEKVFGKDFFDSEFPKKAADFLTAQNIDDASSYFVFLQDKARSKKITNPRGFVYKLFFQPDIAQEFKNSKQQRSVHEQQEEKNKISCPVCGNSFTPGYGNCCPECDFSIDAFNDKKEIEHHKKYIALDKKQRDSYDEEFRSFKSELSVMSRLAYFNSPQGKIEKAKFVATLDKKYGFG